MTQEEFLLLERITIALERLAELVPYEGPAHLSVKVREE